MKIKEKLTKLVMTERMEIVKERKRLIRKLHDVDPTTDEYEKIQKRIAELKDREKNISWSIDIGKIIAGLLTLVGVVLVTRKEEEGPITSKSFGFLKF